MKHSVVLLLAAAAILFLTGCEASRNLDNARKLRIGMTKPQVLEIMGEPIRNETFAKPDVWYYFIHSEWMDGLTTEEECMPLVFKDGQLIGWGNEYYTRHKLMPEMPKTNQETVRELKLK